MKHQHDIERDLANQPSDYAFKGNGIGTVASNRGLGSLLRRVAISAAAGTIIVALLELLNYASGLGLFGGIHSDYIPMAPSTAVNFIVLASALLVLSWRSYSKASLVILIALAVLVSLFGLLEVGGHFTGRDLNFENLLVPNGESIEELQITHMSLSTGATFFLAGLAVLALVLRQSRFFGRESSLGHWGGILGSLVLGIGLLFCLAYIFGSPLLYGQGTMVPMALTTALAFIMLGAATVGVVGEEAIPLSLLRVSKPAGKPMSVRKRFLLLALTMIAACAIIMAVMTVILYRYELGRQREMLQVTAQSQARLIEAIARHETERIGISRDDNPDYKAFAATMRQIADAHENFEGFGKTGEFTLARREGDSIVFVLQHRHNVIEQPKPVPFDSDLAEPMHRALEGLSGTMVGLDYRGATVLAAYEPVGVLNLGIVAKIDLNEIRTPFIRAGLAASFFAFLVVLAGTGLFFRVANPLVLQLEAYSRDLEKEVDDRKRAEEELKSSEAFLERVIQFSPFAMWIADENGTIVSTNRSLREALKLPDEKIVGKYNILADENLVAQGVAAQVRDVFEKLEPTRFTIVWSGKKTGVVDFEEASDLVVDTSMFPIVNNDGILINVVCQWVDISERKRAEKALKKSEEHLRLKLDTLLSPDVDIEDYELNNIFDMPAMQSLLDAFSKLTGIVTAILDLKGNILLAAGWQDICTKFHRVHPDTSRACTESDLFFTKNTQPKQFVAYKCRNHLCDMATPLMIGDKHVGNIYTGQFFYEDENVDRQVFIDLAEKCGFDKESYLDALDRVPRISREKAESIMKYLMEFSEMISKLSYGNVKLAKAMLEQKRAKEILKESKSRLLEAQRMAHLGFWVWNVRTGDVEWSDEVYKIFHLSPEEFTPQIDSIQKLSPWPEDHQRDKELIRRAIDSHEQGVYEQRFLRPDGSTGYYFSTFQGMYDDNGDLTTLKGTVQDITERKLVEKEREALIAKLESQNAELERFTYTVSHDLKSPLITIKGFAGMLKQDLTEGDPAQVESDLTRISGAADKMNQLLADLLELSRVGRLVNPPEDVPLGELALEAVELVDGLIKENGVDVEISPDLPVVFGDRLRLLEVLQNLIDNAMKYMGDQPRPRIEIGSRSDGAQTVYYVKDNGMGVEAAYQDKVFELFEQLDQRVEGSGIGLALVKRIVEVHGGRIWVESEGAGRGSTFCFTLSAENESSQSQYNESLAAK